MSRTTIVYLLCFAHNPYKHAKHYLGSTSNLERRLEEHRRGQGARLMSVISDAGIDFVLARTWEGGKDKERQLKKRGGHSKLCPICKARKTNSNETPPYEGN